MRVRVVLEGKQYCKCIFPTKLTGLERYKAIKLEEEIYESGADNCS